MSTTLQKITLDGTEYVRADSIPAGDPTPVQIVVIEGRWNIVGNVETTETGIVITNAKVIRYWGTTKGLGELALNGPTGKTILDPCGTVRVPAAAVLLTMDTDAGKW